MKNTNTFKRLRSRVSLFASVVGFVGVSAVPLDVASAETKTFYRETFQYCTGSLGKPAADQTGWFALVTGLQRERFGNLKVFSYGSTIIGDAVNSSPNGKAQGYSFWYKPTYGLSVITSEFSFDVELLSKYPSSVEYEQRLSGVDASGLLNQTQLAFLIDNDWYISGTAVRPTKVGSWEPVKLDPSQLLYGRVPEVAGLGVGAPQAYDNSLPLSGKVRAFGVFLGEVNGRVRIDNFTLKTTGTIPANIPAMVQSPSVALCPATSPDVTGAPVPTPTPDPDDSDSGIDNGTPPGGTPTPGPTPHTHVASFCSTREQGSGLRVRVGRASQKAFVSKSLPKGVRGLRDNALAYLYSSRVMPIGAAVNVRMGDYNRSTGALKLSLKKGKSPTSIKLPRVVQTALNRYLARLGKNVATTDAMFGAAKARQTSVDIKTAACAAELKAVLAQRARAARLSTAKVFVR